MDATVMDCSPSSNAAPPRRSGRRKMVQSTLFPLKPPEPVEKNDKEDERDEDHSEAENNKKKRKRSKAKATPPKKGSSKSPAPKRKSTANGTKGLTSQQVLVNSDQVKAPVYDLFLEAKLSAEEDSRMYAGRQVHPFFSLWKEAKKVPDVSESGSNLPTAKSKHKRATCGPIHVFENVKDDTSSIDWRNWTFMGNTTSMNYGQESPKSSVLEGSVESLNFDKLHSSLNPSGVSISQNALSSDRLSIIPKKLEEASSPASLVEKTCLTCENAELDMEVDESAPTTVQAGIFRKSKDTEPPSRFLQESMRSYYHSCVDMEECNLWTYKYMPKKAVEVCGNDKSVNLLSDWLHCWHERRYKSRKDNADMDKSDMQNVEDDDDDYKCSYSDYDSEDINEKDSLQKVLLITGPVGSGKSSAVYACAKEQGFNILEINSSHSRNGTAIRNLEYTLTSHGFKRQSRNTASSHKTSIKLPQAPAMLSGKAADEANGVDELLTISDDEAHSPSGSTLKLHGENDDTKKYNVHPLVLVEDVDILFAEDRGCIAAIQQIAETSKGPIILTSNSDNPGLPHKFDILHVPFVLPSPKELLCHLYTVCLTEGINIHPLLLEKFIHSCDGDIRKTIMHLQFWFQTKTFQKDEKAQTGYGSLPFDLELGHQILPKIMPWDFPSVISELIEIEIAKPTNIIEENSKGLVTKDLHLSEWQKDLNVKYMETDDIEAMKVEMIKRNGSYYELEIPHSTISEFSNSSGSPLASSRHNGRRKLVVMTSESEDEDSNNGYPVDSHDEANNRQLMKENNRSPSEFHLNGNYPDTSVHRIVCPDLEHSEEEYFKYSETADGTYLNETIITTKHDLRRISQADSIFQVELMNTDESLELLSWHAFREAKPKEDYIFLAERVVSYCGGLPLALEVIGSYLYERTKEEWNRVLIRLDNIPHNEVPQILKISFDGLCNQMEKDLFLDLICSYVGRGRGNVTKILNGCGIDADSGIRVLIKRSLIRVNKNNKLGMHPLIRQMGINIFTEIFDENMKLGILFSSPGTRVIHGWPSTRDYQDSSRLLKLAADSKYLLRWISLRGFSSEYLPNDFYLHDAIVIDLKHSFLRLVWKEPQVLTWLKVLNLSHSKYLIETPDFSGLPSLEQLILEDCPRLREVHQSIGCLSNLILLNLKDCTSLSNLPGEIYKLKCLKTLILCGCSKIDLMDKDIVGMKSFMTTIAENTAMKQLPFTIVSPKSIGYISLRGLEGLSHNLFPFIIRSRMSPTMNPLSYIHSFMHMEDNNWDDISPLLSSLENLRSVSVQCDAEFQLSEQVKTIVAEYGANVRESVLSKHHVRYSLTGVGRYKEFFNTVSDIIPKVFESSESCDVSLPGDNDPYWLAHMGEGHSVSFTVPQDRVVKGMALCVVYLSTSEIIEPELTTVLIVNYTKFTCQIHNHGTVISFNNEDWADIMSNLGSGDKVEIFVSFGNGLVVKNTSVYLICSESMPKKNSFTRFIKKIVM